MYQRLAYCISCWYSRVMGNGRFIDGQKNSSTEQFGENEWLQLDAKRGSGSQQNDAAAELADAAHRLLVSRRQHPRDVGFVVTSASLRPFEIDTIAFERWVEAKGEELDSDIPQRCQQYPAAALSNFSLFRRKWLYMSTHHLKTWQFFHL